MCVCLDVSVVTSSSFAKKENKVREKFKPNLREEEREEEKRRESEGKRGKERDEGREEKSRTKDCGRGVKREEEGKGDKESSVIQQAMLPQAKRNLPLMKFTR